VKDKTVAGVQFRGEKSSPTSVEVDNANLQEMMHHNQAQNRVIVMIGC